MNDPYNSLKTIGQLETEGWKLASITGGKHLKRMLDMYEELGIEVYLEKAPAEKCQHCTKCYEQEKEFIFNVYTRTST